AFSDPHAVARQPWLFGAMLVCVVVLDVARIDLFERANVSPASSVVIAMALLFGVVGAVASELLIAAWRLGRRDPAVKVVFDLAALTLAGAAAAGVGLLADATRADVSLLGFGALAAVAYYAVNSVLVAIAI